MILERNPVELTPLQLKMLKSGWGEAAVENTLVESITYLSGGLKVKGYIAAPLDQSKKYPCVIWCRGGIGNAGAIDSFNAKGIFGQIASWGYVVFASQYRGNSGGEGHDEFGGSDLEDVLNLTELARFVPNADENKWAIEGWSRGGMMTYLALTRTDIFKAAIVSGGIANLHCNAGESNFMRKLYQVTMGKFGDKEFALKCFERSIVNFPEKMYENTPLLIIHGTADNRVLPHDSIDLARKLIDLKFPFRLVLLENADHFLKPLRKEADSVRREWLEKHLK